MAEGFTAIKLAPFDELKARDHIRTGPRTAWRPGVERVRSVRKAIGDGPQVFVLNGVTAEDADMLSGAKLMPVLNSIAQIQLWKARGPAAPALTLHDAVEAMLTRDEFILGGFGELTAM